MTSIDYMKVLETASFTLGTSATFDFSTLDLNMFKAVLTAEDGKKTEILMKVNSYHIELFIEKQAISSRDFTRWLPKFEFGLEQALYRNISIEHSESARDHIVTINF